MGESDWRITSRYLSERTCNILFVSFTTTVYLLDPVWSSRWSGKSCKGQFLVTDISTSRARLVDSYLKNKFNSCLLLSFYCTRFLYCLAFHGVWDDFFTAFLKLRPGNCKIQDTQEEGSFKTSPLDRKMNLYTYASLTSHYKYFPSGFRLANEYEDT